MSPVSPERPSGRAGARREGGRPGLAALLPLGLLVLASAACGERTGARGEGEPRADSAAVLPVDSAAPATGAGGDSLPPPGDTLGRDLPTLPGEEPIREPVTYRLLLVNPNPGEAIVQASAGAGPVVLDTVPGEDSVRLDVRVRARQLRLDAAEVGGRSLGSMELLLEEDSLNRWELPYARRNVEVESVPEVSPRSL